MISHRGVLTGSSYVSMFFLGVGTAVIGAASGSIGHTPYETGLLISVQNVGFIVSVLASGALADSSDKARLMSAGSLLLAVSFFLYYLWPAYVVNLVIMLFIGAGIGTYEGVADAMLLGIHKKRQGLHISVNHFFATFGALGITLYLIFLDMDWHRSMVQSAAVVLALAVLFFFSRAGKGTGESSSLSQRMKILRTQGVLAVFLMLATFGVGIELGLTGLLPGFLRSLRGYEVVPSNIGLVLFLGGIAAGRVLLGLLTARVRLLVMVRWLFAAAALCSSVLFFVVLPPAATAVMLVLTGAGVSSLLPLLITLTGTIYRDMSGTALGIVKLAVPVGGIVVPFIVSLLTRWASFAVALGIFPLLAVMGLLILVLGGKRIQAQITALRS
jgi:MFS family permease